MITCLLAELVIAEWEDIMVNIHLMHLLMKSQFLKKEKLNFK